MAKLELSTFLTDRQGKELLEKVKKVLSNLTGVSASKDGTHWTAPVKLDVDRDSSVPKYRSVWQ